MEHYGEPGGGQKEPVYRFLAGVGLEEVLGRVDNRMLRAAEVAVLFGVSPRTVAGWARQGRLPSVRTPGGQRRFPAGEIRRFLGGGGAVMAERPDAGRP